MKKSDVCSKKIRELIEKLNDLDLKSLIEKVINLSTLNQYYELKKNEESLSKQENLEELLSTAERFYQNNMDSENDNVRDAINREIRSSHTTFFQWTCSSWTRGMEIWQHVEAVMHLFFMEFIIEIPLPSSTFFLALAFPETGSFLRSTGLNIFLPPQEMSRKDDIINKQIIFFINMKLLGNYINY